MMLPQIGKMLLIFGAVLALVGLLLIFSDRIGFLGKLPGDLSFSRGNWSFYISIATSIILSVLLTIILNLFGRGK